MRVMREPGKINKNRMLHMLLFPAVLRGTCLVLRLRVVGLGLLCGLVRVEIFRSAEEKYVRFRGYRGRQR